MLLLVGLGNPGPDYARHRHNIGFMAADRIADDWGFSPWRRRFQGDTAEGRLDGRKVLLLKPLTFMNESGKSAGPAAGSRHIPPDRIIAVHDEIDLPFGEVRTRLGGGLAGHNGLKSLKSGFGTSEFWRVRVGVDRPDSTDPERVAGYVLGRFSESGEEVRDLIESGADETERLVEKLNAAEGGEEEMKS